MPEPGKGIDRGARTLIRARRAFQKLAESLSYAGGDGIEIDEDTLTISIDLATNPGLEFTGGKLRVDASTGIVLTASGVEMDINGLTASGTADDADEIAIYDNSAGAIRKQTRSNFLSGLTAESGIDKFSRRQFLPAWTGLGGNFQCDSGDLHAIYMGYVLDGLTIDYVWFYLITSYTISGAGSRSEVGIFSSPLGPRGVDGAQNLTKIDAAIVSTSALTTTGWKSNTTAMNASVPADTHLWAVVTIDEGSAGTAGRLGPALQGERGRGWVQYQATAPSILTNTTYSSMSLPTAASNGPFLFLDWDTP